MNHSHHQIELSMNAVMHGHICGKMKYCNLDLILPTQVVEYCQKIFT